MIHDIYYERQCAVIARAQQAEREREEYEESMRRYRHEQESRSAYFRLQGAKRYRIMRDCKMQRSKKKPHATITKCEAMVYRTRRFDNSYITVYCKGRPTT